MSLAPGARVGPYEILSPLGRGGMGEVWRARDGKLRREVAIKALPVEFASDAERRARFEREAHLLASLNHPNVAAIYGLEESGDLSFLVLELVEGQTLDEKLAAGPLSISETVSVAAQIAAGLEAAHEAGVIHRDLKPSNIKVRPDGSVKVLDLGLARVVDPGAQQGDVSQSPTMTTGGTRSGVILGTAAYMSPEQARGKPLDKRTDIFSFGCVLYECLTGKRAFRGETVSDTLAAILTAEPDWSALPAGTPAALSHLTRRCLRKDRKQRLHDIADARIEIEESPDGAPGGAAGTMPAPPARARMRVAWGVGGALLGAAIAAFALLSRRQPALPASPVHAVLPVGAGTRLLVDLPSLAISPDGRTVVFRALGEGGDRLYRRALEDSHAEPIQGTESGFSPFFSPDGQWLGFFTWDELKKVPLSGGTAISLSRVPPITAGGSWGADGRIVFTAQYNGGLYAIPETGGEPRKLTTLDTSRGEHAHLNPQILPRGRAVLFTLRLGRDFLDTPHSNIAALDSKTGLWRTVLEGASYARYGGGRLVFVRGNSVFSAPFDESRLEATGPAVILAENIADEPDAGVAQFDVSPAGTLAFIDGPSVQLSTTRVLSFDRQGKETPLPVPPGHYGEPRLSADGKRLALSRRAGNGGAVVLFDRERKILSTLTPEPGSYFCPVWSPDGKRIAMSRFESKSPELCVKSADGNGDVEVLTRPNDDAEFPNSWSPDGKTLVYTVAYIADRSATRKLLSTDVWLVFPEARGSERPWFETPFRETAPQFSPDGKWIAYVSDESGTKEIYVRPYPGPGAKIKISNDSGTEPAWTLGGRELLYRTGHESETFMAVGVQLAGELTASTPRPLFSSIVAVGGREDDFREYDVSGDGNEIIALRSVPAEEPSRQLTVVTNWATSAPHAAAPK